MPKEPLIAIAIGSLLGVSVAFGLWKYSDRNNNNSYVGTQTSETSRAEEQPSQNGASEFAVVFPQDLSVHSSTSIGVTGHAPPNSVIVVLLSSVYVTAANENSLFDISVNLRNGVNSIAVMAFGESQVPERVELMVVYTSDVDSSDGLLAVLGTITDIAADTLQIRTQSGQIEQVSISSETTYTSTVSTPSVLEFSDLALGDFVAALGSKNGNNILTAHHVSTTREPEPSQKTAIKGKILSILRNEFLVESRGNKVSIDATGTVVVSRFADGAIVTARLSEATDGDDIIIIGEFSDDELIAERIILL